MADNELAIKIRGLKKSFKVYYDKSNSLKERMIFWQRNRHENRVVLDGVDLDIKKGESVGLIGHNGCGKSTLLKLMTKILYPDEGTIEVNGRVSSLLELGAGFHPDLSGRENIYNNASIFGLSKKEIDDRLGEIVAFSELGTFIDNPVRTYSSGMYMRLAFSVAINVNADILLIDEILAVGDANFQAKCFNKLKEIRNNGTTIVIVSHSLDQIEQFCDKSVWVHEGKVMAQGKPEDIHMQYLEYMGEVRRKKEVLLSGMTPVQIVESQQNESTLRWGSGEVKISSVKAYNCNKEEQSIFYTGEDIRFVIDFKVRDKVENAVFGIGIYRDDGLNIFGTNTKIEKFKDFEIKEDGSYEITLKNNRLLPGKFIVGFSIEQGDVPVDYWKTALEIEIVSHSGRVGTFDLEHDWSFSDKNIVK
ncbi:ABC-2 type transport system ATP-binding protein [Oscillospiraceae bacterium]|nr:ABC-2 type transport system ATP-binding protein [Oscillospiraceae bacterium]